VAVFFGLLVVWIMVTLIDLQILNHETYAARAKAQRLRRHVLPARRGEILASDGLPVAQNITLNLVYAIPVDIQEPQQVAHQLAEILVDDPQQLEQEVELLVPLLSTDSTYALIRQWVDDDKAKLIRDLRIKGIVISPNEKRYYPEGSLLSHVLGYVNRDGDGQYGLEGYYNTLLKGKDGYILREQDNSNRAMPIGENEEVPAIDGANLIITIDRSVQKIVEEELKWGMNRTKAADGSAIVMDPWTGAIIAMANYPDFDPNHYNQVFWDEEGNYQEEGYWVFNNSATSWPYEPGSVFKVVSIAAALDSGALGINDMINDPGFFDLSSSITIRNWDQQAQGLLSLSRCLELSNNVCLAQVALRTGSDNFYRYVEGFGFGSLTGVDLGSELRGNIQAHKRWNDIQTGSASFGQAITVTPLQMITATAAIANGGRLVRPYVVQEILQDAQVVQQEPKIIKQVISKQVSEQVADMMVNVVNRSEGVPAKVQGYQIAGKTGTGQVAKKDGAGYESQIVTASFVGFAPADAPKFIVFIKYNLTTETHPDMRWGSQAAAPVFKRIAENLFKYYQIPPVGI